MGVSDGLVNTIRDTEQLDLRRNDAFGEKSSAGDQDTPEIVLTGSPADANAVIEQTGSQFTQAKAYKSSQNFYRPLKEDIHEIRLLVVEPGENYEPLHCQLVYMSMTEAILHGYEAVSYCWGDKNDTSTIEISGLELTVPTSAKQAVLRFRNKTEPRHLWIDSVCLNQHDDQEKTYQVARMHHVYRNSSKTLIWLGEDGGTVEKAMRIIEDLLEEIRDKTIDEHGFNDLVGDGLAPSTTGTISFDSQPLVSLFARPWFRRLWVVQEVTLSLSNACYCGLHSFELRSVAQVARWLYFKRRFLSDELRSGHGLRFVSKLCPFTDQRPGYYPTIVAKSNVRFIWLSLLHNLRDNECHDPKDHIFGLLGIYQHSIRTSRLPALLTPMYSKSLAEVMRDATKHVISSSGNLTCLKAVKNRVEDQDNNANHWPSWVPRWHVSNKERSDATVLRQHSHADGRRYLKTKDNTNPDILQVRGIVVEGWEASEVYAITAICARKHRLLMKSFIREVFELWEACGTSEEIQGLAMTLTAGLDANYSKATSFQVLEDFLCFKRQWDNTEATLPTLEDAIDPDALRAYWYYHTMGQWANRRRFFITAGGRPGLGPQTMQEGDIVTILFGCNWPCVLRRRQNTEYEFIGCCYVAGIMEGEAVEKHDEEGKQDEWFAIR